jgi:hypothetical protein
MWLEEVCVQGQAVVAAAVMWPCIAPLRVTRSLSSSCKAGQRTPMQRSSTATQQHSRQHTTGSTQQRMISDSLRLSGWLAMKHCSDRHAHAQTRGSHTCF